MELLRFRPVEEGDCQVEAMLHTPITEMAVRRETFPTVVLCPGGGYEMVSQREADPVAQRFFAAGYNVFTLQTYSVGERARDFRPLGELSEAVRQKLCDHLDVICRYPDRAYTSLRQTIGTYCGANPAHIVVGNGSTELISLLISQRAPKKALVLGPTYSEYARELSLVGGSMEYYHLREADDFVLDIDDFLSHVTGEVDMVILCNPNNPTSSAIPREDMERIIAQCQKQSVFVMIDETYVEFAPDVQAVSAVSLVPSYDNFMVIRGVSKFFAAPGLRFGYGITSNQTFLSALLTHQNPWSLNSIGAFAGEEMLKDTDYIQRTRALVSKERAKMLARLAESSTYKTYPAYANFILARIQKEGVTSFDVFEKTIHQKLMIRDCSSFQELEGEYIRFCVMDPADNDRLMDCLLDV